jgi:hypothetical protein
VDKPSFGAIVNAEKRSICQDRLGTSIGKVQKRERGVFCRDPKRFLTVAETMHAVSIGYDWFFHELSERCALN